MRMAGTDVACGTIVGVMDHRHIDTSAKYRTKEHISYLYILNQYLHEPTHVNRIQVSNPAPSVRGNSGHVDSIRLELKLHIKLL